MNHIAHLFNNNCREGRSRTARLASAFGLFLSLCLFCSYGYAQVTTDRVGAKSSWPAAWIPISSLNDGDDGLGLQYDFVGDATNPGFYQYYDGTYLYFRMRVDLNAYADGAFNGTHFIMIDCGTNDATNSCTGALDDKEDYAFVWDSAATPASKHGLEMTVKSVVGLTAWSDSRFDDLDGLSADKGDADFAVPTDGTTGEGYIRTIDQQSTTNFGNTTFIDFAIQCAYLSTNTNLECTGQTWKIQIGSTANSNDHTTVSEDVGANSSVSSKAWGESIKAAIDLLSFSAQRLSNAVKLAWSTGSEFDCGSFKILRALMGKRMGEWMDPVQLAPDAVLCRGKAAGSAYEIEDRSARSDGSYAYFLTQHDLSGGQRKFGPLILNAGEARSSFSPK